MPDAMQNLRERYPEYADIPDGELAEKIVAKYPVYRADFQKYLPASPSSANHDTTVATQAPIPPRQAPAPNSSALMQQDTSGLLAGGMAGVAPGAPRVPVSSDLAQGQAAQRIKQNIAFHQQEQIRARAADAQSKLRLDEAMRQLGNFNLVGAAQAIRLEDLNPFSRTVTAPMQQAAGMALGNMGGPPIVHNGKSTQPIASAMRQQLAGRPLSEQMQAQDPRSIFHAVNPDLAAELSQKTNNPVLGVARGFLDTAMGFGTVENGLMALGLPANVPLIQHAVQGTFGALAAQGTAQAFKEFEDSGFKDWNAAGKMLAMAATGGAIAAHAGKPMLAAARASLIADRLADTNINYTPDQLSRAAAVAKIDPALLQKAFAKRQATHANTVQRVADTQAKVDPLVRAATLAPLGGTPPVAEAGAAPDATVAKPVVATKAVAQAAPEPIAAPAVEAARPVQPPAPAVVPPAAEVPVETPPVQAVAQRTPQGEANVTQPVKPSRKAANAKAVPLDANAGEAGSQAATEAPNAQVNKADAQAQVEPFADWVKKQPRGQVYTRAADLWKAYKAENPAATKAEFGQKFQELAASPEHEIVTPSANDKPADIFTFQDSTGKPVRVTGVRPATAPAGEVPAAKVTTAPDPSLVEKHPSGATLTYEHGKGEHLTLWERQRLSLDESKTPTSGTSRVTEIGRSFSLAEKYKDVIKGNTLYHEVSPAKVGSLLSALESRRGHGLLYASDNPDLALGQGGRGAILEIDPKRVNGEMHGKVGAMISSEMGMGSEFRVTRSIPNSVKAVTFKSRIGLTNAMKQEGFSRLFDGDSAVKTDRGWRVERKPAAVPKKVVVATTSAPEKPAEAPATKPATAPPRPPRTVKAPAAAPEPAASVDIRDDPELVRLQRIADGYDGDLVRAERNIKRGKGTEEEYDALQLKFDAAHREMSDRLKVLQQVNAPEPAQKLLRATKTETAGPVRLSPNEATTLGFWHDTGNVFGDKLSAAEKPVALTSEQANAMRRIVEANKLDKAKFPSLYPKEPAKPKLSAKDVQVQSKGPQALQAGVTPENIGRAILGDERYEKATEGGKRLVDATLDSLNPARTASGTQNALIGREKLAEGARSAYQREQVFKPFRVAFDKTPEGKNLRYIFDMEGGKPQSVLRREVSNTLLRDALDKKYVEAMQVAAEGKGKSVTAQEVLDAGIKDYFPHQWKNPKAAAQFLGEFSRPLEGSKGFMKKRTIPTTEEGMFPKGTPANLDRMGLAEIKAEVKRQGGLEPITYNPADMVQLKLAQMDHYITGQRWFQEMKQSGLAIHLPELGSMPDGWAPINDKIAKTTEIRETQKADGSPGAPEMVKRGQWIAPEGAARIMNNYLSTGLDHPFMQGAKYLNNAINMAQLGLSGFHATTTAMNSIVSENARALDAALSGKPLKAAQHLAWANTGAAPIRDMVLGSRFIKEYNKPGSTNAATSTLVDSAIRGGARADLSREFRLGAMESFGKSLRTKDVRGVVGNALPAALETSMAPLMRYAVPRMKLGAFMELMGDEIAKNPGMTPEQHAKTAARAWDSIENRFGQLNYDNLFWHKTLKDAMHLGVRSLGWNLGTLRELGGGGMDVLTSRSRIAGGDRVLTPRMAYTVSLGFTTSIAGAVYGYLHGHPPKTPEDYFHPIGPDGKRVNLPGYVKDVESYIRDVGTTLRKKVSPLVAIVDQWSNNKDFFGKPIRNLNDPVMKRAQQDAAYLLKQFVPFSVRDDKDNFMEAVKKTVTTQKGREQFFGITPMSGGRPQKKGGKSLMPRPPSISLPRPDRVAP